MPVTLDWIERYLADETEFYRDPDTAGLDPPLAALIQEKLRGGLARLNAVPESDPFWKDTNGEPTFGKLYEHLESALALNPGDEEARWILFALGLHHGDNDSWLKSLGPLAENDPPLLRWLVAAGRFTLLRTGHNPGAALRDFLKRLAKKTPGTRERIDRMEDDPDEHVRKMASLATALLQDEDALLEEAEEFRTPREPAEARDIVMKSVYSTGDPAEASTLLAILRTRGIECFLENEGSAMYAIGMPSPAVPLVLSVPGADAEKATSIIGEVLKERRCKGNAVEGTPGGKAAPPPRHQAGIWALYVCAAFPPALLFLFLRPEFRWLRWPAAIAIAIGLIVAIPLSRGWYAGYALFAFLCIAWSLLCTACVIWLKRRPGNPR